MAAPPDLINDPPSLICRYKDRSLKTRSLFPFPPPPRSSPSPRRGHQGERDREQTFISVLERANARKGGLRPPLPSLSLSLLLSFRCCSSKRHDLCSLFCRGSPRRCFSTLFAVLLHPRGEPPFDKLCAKTLVKLDPSNPLQSIHRPTMFLSTHEYAPFVLSRIFEEITILERKRSKGGRKISAKDRRYSVRE